MAEASLNALVQQIRCVVACHHYRGMSDGILLGRFVAERDELAFKELVRRHGALVLGVCRRLVGTGPDVEDVFQATFLVLARKAGAIRRKDSIASWLYGVAFHLARKLQKQLQRRRKHEHGGRSLEAIAETSSMAVDPGERANISELAAILDQEIQHLPARNREALVLCHLQGLSATDVAKRLRCPLPTLKSRLVRARDLLRQRLVRRGVTLSATGVAVVLAEQAAHATVPRTVVHAAVQAAVAFAIKPVAGAAVSVQAAALAKETLKTMVITKLTLAMFAIFSVALLGAGVAMVSAQTAAEAPPANRVSQPGAKAGQTSPAAEDQEGQRKLRVVVLDPQAKPLPGAKVHASIWTDEKNFKSNADYQTNADGVALVKLPRTIHILRLWANKGKLVWMFANWEQSELASGLALPSEYTMRLESGITIGGRLVDEQGKPVVGVSVEAGLKNDPKPFHSDGRARYNTWLATGNDRATTDADGRWHIVNAPDHPDAKVSLFISHPDYVSDEDWGGIQKSAGITMAMLREKTATVTLKRGVILQGRVMDPAGKPIKDAILVHGDDPYSTWMTSKFTTDAAGRFRLPALAPGDTTLTVVACGWAPQMRKVRLRPGLGQQDFQMALGKTIRLRIVDAARKAIPRASVSIVGWQGSKSIQTMHNPNHPKVPDTGIPSQTDADGVWQWTSAPEGLVKLHVYAKDFGSSEVDIAGGDAMRTVTLTVTLKGKHNVTGRVVDAVTGKAIPAFTVIPLDVFTKNFLNAERSHGRTGKNGILRFVPNREDIPLRLRIEAPGYRSQDGPEFRHGDQANRTQDFRLQPSQPLTGSVLDIAGKPLQITAVLLATPTEHVELWSPNTGIEHNHITFTDAAGEFVFPDPGEPCAAVVQTDSGFAYAEYPVGQHDLGKLRVQPWASVGGRLCDGGKPVKDATILLAPVRLNSLDRPRIQATMKTITDADGRFQFPRVPPGPVNVQAFLGPWKEEGFRSGPNVPLTLLPGQRADLHLGSGGAIVKGKVTLAGTVPANLNCTYSLNYLVRRTPGIVLPTFADLGFNLRNGWQETWQHTAEGLAYLSTLQHWFVKLAPDGAFQISGVPAGEYDFTIAIYAKPSGCLVDPLAKTTVRVTVTEADTRGQLVLPEIKATVVPIPAVGDMPTLAYRRADGTSGTLADHRGHWVLVHFWASWCVQCKRQFPELERLHDRYAPGGLTMLGLSLDTDATAWQSARKRLALRWPQGRLRTTNISGVSTVPAYWLLDPSGAIAGKSFDLDELSVVLSNRLK